MTRERFEELAQAYGGDIARWPATERDAAALLGAESPDFAREVLAREASLDFVLGEAPRLSASPRLFEAILASAPAPRPRARLSFWLGPAGLTAGLAAATFAGVLLGVQVGERTWSGTDVATQSATALDISAVAEEG